MESLKPKLLNRKKSKEVKLFKGERGFVYPYGYEETDPYILVGEHTVISVFDVLIQYGTNRPAGVGWLLRIIPQQQIESGKIKLIQRQRGMERQTESEIIETRLDSNKSTLKREKTPSAKQKTLNAARLYDMSLAEGLAGDEDSVYDSDVRLIVKSNSAEDVEKVIDEIKLSYKNSAVKGVMIVRRTGTQLEEFRNIFNEVSSDAWHNSDMGGVTAGRLFFPSSGFSDPEGVFVGYDRRSLLHNNPSMIDFRGVKNAIVFMGGIAPQVSAGGLEGAMKVKNGGSAVGHVITQGNWFNGNRTHHILLHDFKFFAENSRVFDMSKEAINPFEVFGSPETVQSDANANNDKTSTMFTLISDIEDPDKLASMKRDIKALALDWLIYRANGNGIYTDDPEGNPMKAQRILATDNHESYPTAWHFIQELKGNTAKQSKLGERAQKEASDIEKTISTAVTEYPNIFGKPTTLPNVLKSSERNIYYDLSGVSEDKLIKGVVFLNTLAYVANRALEGEVICIHGLDQVRIPEKSLLPYKEKMERKNIGLITIFDKSENEVNPSSYSRFVGKLSRQDMVVLGGLTTKELGYINESWDRTLPNTVASELLRSQDRMLYFYRKKDKVAALVETHLVL